MARNFGGGTDGISYGTSGGVGAGNPWSCFAWSRPASFSTSMGIVSKRDAGSTGNNQFDFEYVSGGQLATTADGNFFISSGAATTGVWNAVGCTCDASTTNIYINGSDAGSSADGGARQSGSGTGQGFRVGFTGDGKNTNGDLADVAVWSVKLTAQEMAALARGVRPNLIRRASLVFWAPLEGIQSNEPSLAGVTPFTATLSGTSKVSGPPMNMFTPRWVSYLIAAAGGTVNPKTITVTCTTSTAFVRSTAHKLAVTCTSATALVRQTAHKIAVTCTSTTAAINAIKVKLQTITVTCTTTTAFGAKQVAKKVAVTCTSAVSVTKAIAHKIAVTCTSAVAVIATPFILGATAARRLVNLTIFRK